MGSSCAAVRTSPPPVRKRYPAAIPNEATTRFVRNDEISTMTSPSQLLATGNVHAVGVHSSFSKFVSGLPHRPRERRPIVNIAAKDVDDHAARERGRQQIEHDRRVASL